ncbi:restriction endonuclease subunit S [bacterium]|nr:restriction endonuclease subunit S [bacterium]
MSLSFTDKIAEAGAVNYQGGKLCFHHSYLSVEHKGEKKNIDEFLHFYHLKNLDEIKSEKVSHIPQSAGG